MSAELKLAAAESCCSQRAVRREIFAAHAAAAESVLATEEGDSRFERHSEETGVEEESIVPIAAVAAEEDMIADLVELGENSQQNVQASRLSGGSGISRGSKEDLGCGGGAKC